VELDVIYNQDCIKGMQAIPDKSIHMILCDLPYGTTACKWDSIIPFEELWKEYCRIIHCDGYRLEQKYIQPLQQYANQFYIQNIKMKG